MDWNSLEQTPPRESVIIFGQECKKGDRVRLWPVKSADIFDIALNGQAAIIDSIEEDYEGKIYVAVVLEDDPGREIGEMKLPAHRFFFSAEELEPLEFNTENTEGTERKL